jgi:hypothetical protein
VSKYSQLALTFCRSYEHLLLNPGNLEMPRILFSVLLDCVRAPSNLKVSFELLEFWVEFKQSCFEYLEEDIKEPHFRYLAEPFAELVNVLLVQCQRLRNPGVAVADLEEAESDARGMSVLKFREHACEVFQKAYFVLKKIVGNDGEKVIFERIGAAIAS